MDTSNIDIKAVIDQLCCIAWKKPVRSHGETVYKGGPCPFCHQGTDRFAVFPEGDKPHFYCGINGNGCGAHGDVITFVMDTTPQQQPLWDWDNQPSEPTQPEKMTPLRDLNNQPLSEPTQPEKTNPCIALYGPHTDERVLCKNCVHLVSIACSRTVYKCALRKNTHSARTDHHLRWPACAKFEERTGEIPIYDGRR